MYVRFMVYGGFYHARFGTLDPESS
jgi:hypothetical protein